MTVDSSNMGMSDSLGRSQCLTAKAQVKALKHEGMLYYSLTEYTFFSKHDSDS